MVFVGFDVALFLIEADVEPLSAGLNFSWEVLGADTNLVYAGGAFGCGVVPNEFDDFAEVFAGGALTGTVCIPISRHRISPTPTRSSP